MAFEVQRKAELTLVSLLGEILPDFTFYPSKGGDDDGGNTLPRPPFGAIWINSAEKTMAQQKTWILGGNIVWITRALTDDVADHSDTVQQIYNALIQINDQTLSTLDSQGQVITPGNTADEIHSLIIHGLDITTVDEFSDAQRDAHGDTISFVMGVTEFD